MPSFQAPLFKHPHGVVPAPPTAASVPKAASSMTEQAAAPIAAAPRPAHVGFTGGPPPGLGQHFQGTRLTPGPGQHFQGTQPTPGLGQHFQAGAVPMPTAISETASASRTHPIMPPGYAAASRPAEKTTQEAPGPSHRSEKLMQKLMEKYPACSREDIKVALKCVHDTKGFKGLTVADIIKATSDVLDKKFPQARAVNAQQPKPRPVLKAMRPSQSAMSQPQPPPPVPQQQKTWTSQNEPRPSWNGRTTQCSICLDDLNGSTKEMRTSCGHCFHEKCLQDWFKTDHTCPNCRAHTLLDTDFPTLGK